MDEQEKQHQQILKKAHEQEAEQAVETAKIGKWEKLGLTFLAFTAWLVLCMLLWYLWSARNSANVAGVASAGLIDIEKQLSAKIEAIDVKGINGAVTELQGEIHDLRGTTTEATAMVSDLRGQTGMLTGALTARVTQIGSNLSSLQALTDEGRHQLKQEGDALNGTILSVTGLVDDQKIKIGNAEVALTRAANGLSTMLETDNPKIASILDHSDKLMISADGTITAFKGLVGERTVTKQPDGSEFVSGTGLTGITENFNGMSLDSRTKLHSLFFPPPAHGFWGHTKQVFGYVLNPVLEGGRIYFSLRSLPVKIVQSVPIPQK